MSIQADARHAIKNAARDALSERWHHLLRFTLPASAALAATYFIGGMMRPDLRGAASIGALRDLVTAQPVSFAVSYILAWLLEVLLYAPVLMCIAAFFLERSSPDAIGEERALYRTAPAPKLKPAAQNFAWVLEPTLLLRALRMRLAVSAIGSAACALCMAPGLFLLLRAAFSGNPDAGGHQAVRLGLILMVIGFAAGRIFAAKFAAAPFILAQTQDMTVRRALRESCEVLRGRELEYVIFSLSFAGWYAISLLSFGAALVYVLPYRATCEAMFMRYADADGDWNIYHRKV